MDAALRGGERCSIGVMSIRRNVLMYAERRLGGVGLTEI